VIVRLGICDVCHRQSLTRHTGARWLCAYDWGVLFGEAML
jgi:hypothetical protein